MRLKAGVVAVALLSLLAASLVKAAAPENSAELVRFVGLSGEVMPGVVADVQPLAVADSLTGVAIDRDPGPPFLVLRIGLTTRLDTYTSLRLRVLSDGVAYGSAESVFAPDPGFRSTRDVAFMMPLEAMAGSHLVIEQTAFVIGIHQRTDFDLGLTPQRVDELRAATASPLKLQSDQTEVAP
ncbi:MAG: hypothetical protein LBR32_01010 [Propionibacteriaceae bacterium]|jgi:hypothetical protein|nr:hypothetical protein [Propionibacteriaceae bacterium]